MALQSEKSRHERAKPRRCGRQLPRRDRPGDRRSRNAREFSGGPPKSAALAGPNRFDQFDAPAPAPAVAQPVAAPAKTPNFFDQFDEPAADPATTPVYSGSVLPLTRYQDGHVGVDSNADVLGALKSAFTLPGDVATGKVDPNSADAIARAAGMASLAQPLAPGAGIVSTGAKAVAVPTADALHAAATAAYANARDLGVEYAAPAVADMARGVQSSLNDSGVLGVLAPKTHAILDQLQQTPQGAGSVPFGSLEAARKAFGLAGRDFTNPTEQHAAGIAKNAIDDFVSNPSAQNVVAGPANDVASIIADARGNFGAAARSDALNGLEQTAELRAATANSGKNLGNNIRGRVASLLGNDKQILGFSPAEVAALDRVVRGTPVQNVTRQAGNMLGGGGGLGTHIAGAAGAVAGGALGGAEGAGVGAILAPIAGAALKAFSNGLTANALGAVDELVRSRSPLYAAASANAPQVLNLGDTLANGAVRPLSSAFVLSGVNSSLANADPNSRAASLGAVLAGTHPALSALPEGLAGVFGNLDGARAAFAP